MECAQTNDLLASQQETKTEVETGNPSLEKSPNEIIESQEGKREDASEAIQTLKDSSIVVESIEVDATGTEKKTTQKNEANSKIKKSTVKEREEITETKGSPSKQIKSNEESLAQTNNEIKEIFTILAEATTNENGDPENGKKSVEKEGKNSKSKSKSKKDETSNEKLDNENIQANQNNKSVTKSQFVEKLSETKQQSSNELKRSQINDAGLVNFEEPTKETVKSVKKSTVKSNGKSKQKKQASID